MRLFDVDAYLKKVCTYKETGCGSCRFQTVCPTDEPTIDAVPVVRCKDCIHRPIGDPCKHNVQPPKENDYRCPCLCEDDWYSWTPTDDWFCGNGERK